MACSVEGSVPFLDHNIIDQCLTINESQFIKKNESFFLKGIAKKYLSKEIINRRKEGFNVPITKWIKNWPKEIEYELTQNFCGVLSKIIDQDSVLNWLNNPKKTKCRCIIVIIIYFKSLDSRKIYKILK